MSKYLLSDDPKFVQSETVTDIRKYKTERSESYYGYFAHSETLPSDFVTYLLTCPFTRLEKKALQIERAADYFCRTHPKFDRHFVLGISFLQEDSPLYPSGIDPFSLSAQTKLREVVKTITAENHEIVDCDESDSTNPNDLMTIRRKFGELDDSDKVDEVKTTASAVESTKTSANANVSVSDDLKHFFWALVELILLYNDNYKTFLSLHFDEAYWANDVKVMLKRLSTVNLFNLQHKLLGISTKLEFCSEIKSSSRKKKKSKIANNLSNLSNDRVVKNINFEICKTITDIVSQQMQQDSAKSLETMFLRMPCAALADKLGKQLPWDFLMKHGDRDKWHSAANKIFTVELRQHTNLITALTDTVLGYLWNTQKTTSKKKSLNLIYAEKTGRIRVGPVPRYPQLARPVPMCGDLDSWSGVANIRIPLDFWHTTNSVIDRRFQQTSNASETYKSLDSFMEWEQNNRREQVSAAVFVEWEQSSTKTNIKTKVKVKAKITGTRNNNSNTDDDGDASNSKVDKATTAAIQRNSQKSSHTLQTFHAPSRRYDRNRSGFGGR